MIDGDTLEIAGQRIRLHGIDAPETRQLCYLGPEPGASHLSMLPIGVSAGIDEPLITSSGR